MTADLSALIARLEAAEVGDQDLSLEVNVALEGGEPVGKMANYVMEPYWAIRRPNPAYVGGFENGPNYPVTTSLDAALALAERVLPGCCVLVGDYKGLANHTRWNGEGDARATKGWCSLSPDDAASSNHRVHAHTPALALCIAVLKAKQGEGE